MRLPAPGPGRPIALPPSSGKAGPIGPGAGPLLTEYLLPTVLPTQAQEKMARMLKIGNEVDWTRAAERVIGSKIAGCEWHVEDPDKETIDDDYKGDKAEVAKDLYHLLDDPQGEIPLDDIGRRMSRRSFLRVTSRHMGFAGSGAWMYDMRDPSGAPHGLLYIRPDRLTPSCNKAGILQGWYLDKRPGDPGTPIAIEDLYLLQFEPPDMGFFGMGLIETALAKAINNGLIDRHYSALLASGGRISGVMAPKEGVIEDDGVFKQIERDWRNVVEQPEAARRLQIVRAPVDFIQTTQSVGEMQIIDLMYHNRDALLALWGVPLSQLGGTVAAGLNSGSTKDKDEAALWQSAIHDRLEEIQEAMQAIADLYEPLLGWKPTVCFDRPQFDDETPAFERAKVAAGMPLRNKERREMLGLDPFDDPALDNAIWMPVNVVAMAMAPDEETGTIPPDQGAGVSAVAPAMPAPTSPGEMAVPGAPGSNTGATGTPVPPRGGTSAPPMPMKATEAKGKASAVAPNPYAPPIRVRGVMQTGAKRLKQNIDRTVTPRLTRAVEAALREQRDAIAAAVEKNWSLIEKHGGRDESMWWREGNIAKPIAAATVGVAEAVSEHIGDVLDGVQH